MPVHKGRLVLGKPANIALDPQCLIGIGYQRDADRRRIARSQNETSRTSHLPRSSKGTSSNNEQKKYGSAQLGEQGLGTLSETASDAYCKHIGGKNRQASCKVVLRQSG
jgi:hypothetical protein